MSRRLRVLTWHVHGNYMFYLSQGSHDFYLPVDRTLGAPYHGRSGPFPWGANVHEVPLQAVAGAQFDCVLYQSRSAWEVDRHRWLSDAQRRLPQIYLEHDPPQQHPTDTRHPVDDPAVLLVHVTHFNRLMWDSGRCPTEVIEHGVVLPRPAAYSGELPRGVVVVNNLSRRGRRLGLDVYTRARAAVPLDLVGMGAESIGGLGEIDNLVLPAFMAPYRFFFNPIRYTSLGLAVIEAMTVGLPVVALATTELAAVLRNEESGILDTREQRLIERMKMLLADPGEARRIGAAGQRVARERFAIGRFVADWDRVLNAHCTGAISAVSLRARSSSTRNLGSLDDA